MGVLTREYFEAHATGAWLARHSVSAQAEAFRPRRLGVRPWQVPRPPREALRGHRVRSLHWCEVPSLVVPGTITIVEAFGRWARDRAGAHALVSPLRAGRMTIIESFV